MCRNILPPLPCLCLFALVTIYSTAHSEGAIVELSASNINEEIYIPETACLARVYNSEQCDSDSEQIWRRLEETYSTIPFIKFAFLRCGNNGKEGVCR